MLGKLFMSILEKEQFTVTDIGQSGTLEWISGDELKSLLGLASDTCKREARKGNLIEGHHYVRLGRHTNSKYRWHLPNLRKHFTTRQLAARPPKLS